MRQILLAGLPPRTGEWLAYRLRGETVELLFSADDLTERLLEEQGAALVVLSACGSMDRAEREVARVRAACGPAVPMIVEVDSGQASVQPGFLTRLTQEHGVRRVVPSTASRGDLLSAILAFLPESAPPRPPAATPQAFPILPRRRFPDCVEAAIPAAAPVPPPPPAYRVPPPPPRIEMGIGGIAGLAAPAAPTTDTGDAFGPLVLLDTSLAPRPRVMTDTLPAPRPGAGPAPVHPRPVVLVVSADGELHDTLAAAAGTEYEVRVGRFGELLGMERDDADAPAAVLVDVPAGQEARVWKVLDRVCRRLPGLPVLVATSSDALDDRVNAVRVGAHACVQKPVAPETARQVLARAVPVRRPAPPRVLVVDDDASVLRATDELFGRLGWNVHTVARPAAVWDALATTRPDLLILASQVGGMDGVDLCRAVRSDPRWHRLPVLFLTQTTETPWLYRAYAAGADDHVAKPFWGPDLVSRARNRLRRADICRV